MKLEQSELNNQDAKDQTGIPSKKYSQSQESFYL